MAEATPNEENEKILRSLSFWMKPFCLDINPSRKVFKPILFLSFLLFSGVYASLVISVTAYIWFEHHELTTNKIAELTAVAGTFP